MTEVVEGLKEGDRVVTAEMASEIPASIHAGEPILRRAKISVIVMSSEVETSRDETLKPPPRDSSTSLGMTTTSAAYE